VLGRFEVRRGRLCGWTQRACGAAAARRHLAAAPDGAGACGPAWPDFARRTAELAVRLR
jgi:excinuclease ABC subunit C